ncbi:MAG: hypothetical protein WC785_08515 [Tatlockia sp.]|jgi:hypothetical protein
MNTLLQFVSASGEFANHPDAICFFERRTQHMAKQIEPGVISICGFRHQCHKLIPKDSLNLPYHLSKPSKKEFFLFFRQDQFSSQSGMDEREVNLIKKDHFFQFVTHFREKIAYVNPSLLENQLLENIMEYVACTEYQPSANSRLAL